MFGLSFGEVLIILVLALIVLGPSRLPQMARTLGRTLREFRKATTDIKSSIEDEFYRMDQPQRPAAVTNTTSLAAPAGTAAASTGTGAAASPAEPAPAKTDPDPHA